MARAESIIDLIGNTPLVRINRINLGGALVYAKLESFNPLHSVKDRTALALIEAAEKDGRLKKGAVIIEPTSGNTGIGLAYIGAVKGYRVILCMPETMSVERQKLLAALGADLELTDGKAGMKGAIEKAVELAALTPSAFMPQQFENPANPAVHEETTGPEIWNDMEGNVDFLVAGAGTGGTICGAGRFLKRKNPSIKIIAVEPAGSPVLSGGKAGPHAIQGIGAGFVPKTLDRAVIDEVIAVGDEAAFVMTRRLIREEGIFTGISGGAAMEAALAVSARAENSGKQVVVILPDSGGNYLSTQAFTDK